MSGRRKLKTEELNRINGGIVKYVQQKDDIEKDQLSHFGNIEKTDMYSMGINIKKDDLYIAKPDTQERDVACRRDGFNSLDSYLKPEDKNSVFGGLIAWFKKIFGGN